MKLMSVRVCNEISKQKYEANRDMDHHIPVLFQGETKCHSREGGNPNNVGADLCVCPSDS